MAGYYSIIRFVNNSLSDESIALGLIVLASGAGQGNGSGRQSAQALFRLSETKVEFAKRLNPGAAKLLDFSLKQLHQFFKQDLVDQSAQLLKFPVQVQHEFIDRLSTYCNGFLQFTDPVYIESDQLATAFDRYFHQFIEFNVPDRQTVAEPVETKLRQRIKTELYEPLRGAIDVDYTIRKRQLPSLYFDYHLDGIGVNGAIYAIKSVDLNANYHLDTIQRDLSEFESLIERLNRFAKERGITGRPSYYLVVDPYEGDNRDRKELYDILQSTQQFELIKSAELPKITKRLRQNNVGKFSEKLLE